MSYQAIMDTVSAKVKELQETLKSHQSAIAQATDAIEKYAISKAKSQEEITAIQGAVNAFNATLGLIEQHKSQAPSAPVEGEVV